MPFYEIRYKKVKDGIKKRFTVAPNFERALLKAYLPHDKDVVIESIEELAETKKELRYKLTEAFYNIMNYGILGVDKLDRFEPLTDQDLQAIRSLLEAIEDWLNRADSYLSAMEFEEDWQNETNSNP